MPYSAPELLLVGAAQNLVLQGSGDNTTRPQCLERERDDSVSYDEIGLW